MNAADSMVDVDYLRQLAASAELHALRLDSSSRAHRAVDFYAKARELRRQAYEIESRINYQPTLS